MARTVCLAEVEAQAERAWLGVLIAIAALAGVLMLALLLGQVFSQ